MTDEEGKAENMFRNFGKRVDKFLEEFDEAGERLQKEFQEKYDDLKRSADKLKNESRNRERWQEVEESLKKAGDHLKEAFEAAFRKKKEPE